MSELAIDKFNTSWGSEIKFFHRPGTNDWNTIYSCVMDDEYGLATLSLSEGDTAVDIGAHIGGTTLGLLSRGFNVIAVEPLPENVELIKKNAEENGWSDRLRIINKAIHSNSTDKTIIRYASESTDFGAEHKYIGNSTSDPEYLSIWSGGEEIEVSSISLNDLLKNLQSVSFLKIDCEGAEWRTFESASKKTIEKINKLAAELHSVTGMDDIYKSFHQLIGERFTPISNEKFENTSNSDTIGLAYFEQKVI